MAAGRCGVGAWTTALGTEEAGGVGELTGVGVDVREAGDPERVNKPARRAKRIAGLEGRRGVGVGAVGGGAEGRL